jgi:DNA-binding CsgD family transcriptional regulator
MDMNKILFKNDWIYFLILGILFSGDLKAQNVPQGRPLVQSFDKSTYQAGTQSWQIAEDDRGRIHFANNSGLLTFTGTRWSLRPLPEGTIVRSVVLGAYPFRIFVGGQDELGYFQQNERGILTYHSLKPLIPVAYRRFEDVWDATFSLDQGAFFRASNRIYRFTGDTVQVDTFSNPILFLGQCRGQQWIQLEDKGVFLFDGRDWIPQQLPGFPNQATLMSMHPLGQDDYLLVTNQMGIYRQSGGEISPWFPEVLGSLADHQVLSSLWLPDGRLAFGSFFSGLYIFDPESRALSHIDNTSGLQNKTIYAMHLDQNGNLWLGLDNGIDLVPIQQPYTLLQPDGELMGSGYAIIESADKWYAGTTNGLFTWSAKNPDFSLVAGTRGQVWGLDTIDQDLFMGHNAGAFRISDNRSRKLNPGFGNWTFRTYSKKPNTMVSGNYSGVSLYQKKGDQWQYSHTLDGFTESSRFVEVDQEGNIWVSHPYRGVFRLQPDATLSEVSVKTYTQSDGLPDLSNNFVFTIEGKIVAATPKGVFRYDPEQDQFTRYTLLDSLIGPGQEVLRLRQNDSQIWYITSTEVGFLQIEDLGLEKKIRKTILPGLRNRLVAGFESVYPTGADDVYFGLENGFMHVKLNQLEQSMVFQTLIEEVELITSSDSLLFGGYSTPDSSHIALRPIENAFRFRFGATHFNPNKNVLFRYQLEGLDENWSDWSETAVREYTNLSPGEYVFRVESRVSDVLGGQDSYSFTIQPPWYATRFAYLSYLALIIIILLGLILVPRRRYEREKEKILTERDELDAMHRQKARETQKTIDQLQQEKLQTEVAHKNAELASTTMHLLQKKELIHQLEQEFGKIRKKAQNPDLRQSLKRIQNLLRDDSQLDQDWEQFFQHFDQVHEDFFKRLREQFPDLTPKDHQLCAYLRMNLTTKEIAPLMNISVRGVEISRYRLRKKLDLDSNENLTEFINQV